MKAIFTKYLGYTTTLPARVRAFDQDGHSATVGTSADLPGITSGSEKDTDYHDEAVRRLVTKMKWGPAILYRGATKTGYVYVFLDTENAFRSARQGDTSETSLLAWLGDKALELQASNVLVVHPSVKGLLPTGGPHPTTPYAPAQTQTEEIFRKILDKKDYK